MQDDFTVTVTMIFMLAPVLETYGPAQKRLKRSHGFDVTTHAHAHSVTSRAQLSVMTFHFFIALSN